MEGEIKLGKKIGEGDEKVVYEDPNSKEKVIAVFKERIPESPNTVKARFYFTRILHLLFPNNIPDIHWSGSNPHAYSTKRVDEDLARGIKNSFRLYYKTKKQKEGISELTENLHQLGMGLDIGPYNFMEDSSGQMLYVDSFWPWQEIIGKGLLELNFNIEKNYCCHRRFA